MIVKDGDNYYYKKNSPINDFRKKIAWITDGTLSIVVVCTVMYFLLYVVSVFVGGPIMASIVLGAYYKTAILAFYEVYRLLTCGFLHINFVHFLMNMFSLINVGVLCERIFDKKKFYLILFASIIGGSCFIFAFEGNQLTVGISGGIYGLLGAIVVYMVKTKLIQNQQIAKNLFQTLLVNVLINLLPNVSFMGHLGGFITGVMISLALLSDKESAKHLYISTVLTIVLCISGGFMYKKGAPIYTETDKNYVQVMSTLKLGNRDKMMNQLVSYYGRIR